LLTAGAGLPWLVSMKLKNAQAMKIMDTFGAGGSFTEYYAMGFCRGYHPDGTTTVRDISASQRGKPRSDHYRSTMGKSAAAFSVEMSVRHGPVTLLSLVENSLGKLSLVVAEAESVPGPILEIGNTNSRYRFKIGARKFAEAWNSFGPAHHCAVGIGRIADKIHKLGLFLGIENPIRCADAGRTRYRGAFKNLENRSGVRQS